MICRAALTSVIDENNYAESAFPEQWRKHIDVYPRREECRHVKFQNRNYDERKAPKRCTCITQMTMGIIDSYHIDLAQFDQLIHMNGW